VTAYAHSGEPISREVQSARIALTEGLADLRRSMGLMLSLGMNADRSPWELPALGSITDGRAKRIRNRPHTNDAPGRVPSPGGNAKPMGGRLGAPNRPAPLQGGAKGPADTGETAVLPAVPVTEETGTGGTPSGGFPSRPDPSDPATEVWTLVERAQAGEAEAFGLIYDRYVDTVFRFVYFRVGNRQLAEDLTSDTFLRALKRIGSFTWQGRDLGAWLVTIARNLVADHFKSGRYRLEVTTGDVLDADREDRGPEGSPEAAVVDHITNVALLTAVKQLNPEQQECIVLRFLQGFSVAETANAMGKNEGAIKALQYRAVRALARLLPDGFQP
jgi:RNA polymerase sigma-70 factor (ECF subfamily)